MKKGLGKFVSAATAGSAALVIVSAVKAGDNDDDSNTLNLIHEGFSEAGLQ